MPRLFGRKKDRLALLSQFPSKSGYAEAFRTMQTNLMFTSMDKELRSICVTSATENEGKTNTVANLAYTMAQNGQRVIMVDCDLRKPGLTQRFQQTNAPGLTELISRDLGALISKGCITDINLNDLIQLLRFQNRTGILSLSDEEHKVDLSFYNGSITDIFWKSRPEEKKLAATLIRADLLNNQQAQAAIGHQKKSVQRLGTILINMGMISKADLKKYLSVHLVEAFKTAAAMIDARFTFTPRTGSGISASIEHSVRFEALFNEIFDMHTPAPFLTQMIEDKIIPMDTENLFLLPSGTIPPNPSEMVGSDRMAFVMDNLIMGYDFVIMDTPPVLPASDALLAATHTDGILVVVKANSVNKKYIKDAVQQIENSSAKVLGLVLNRVDVSRERYYKYYKKYYTSYYGKTAD